MVMMTKFHRRKLASAPGSTGIRYQGCGSNFRYCMSFPLHNCNRARFAKRSRAQRKLWKAAGRFGGRHFKRPRTTVFVSLANKTYRKTIWCPRKRGGNHHAGCYDLDLVRSVLWCLLYRHAKSKLQFLRERNYNSSPVPEKPSVRSFSDPSQRRSLFAVVPLFCFRNRVRAARSCEWPRCD